MRASFPIAVGGLVPFSSIDYPGQLSAVVFCQGCPWRCSYCHNPHLQSAKAETDMDWNGIVGWLETRKGLLDAIVFSGGEPLLQRGLAEAMRQSRDLGFRVALHTAGVYPERLYTLLPLIDWIGFDVKAPFDSYDSITKAQGGRAAQRALAHMLDAKKPGEIRCTIDDTSWNESAATRMAEQLGAMGVDRLVVQAFRDAGGTAHPPRPAIVARLAEKIRQVELRGI